MRKTILFSLLILALSGQDALAQEFRGKVINQAGKSMEYVNCVLRDATDGSYMASAITDKEGVFRIKGTKRNATLSLAMLGFQSQELDCEAGNLGTILLIREAKPANEEESEKDMPPVVMNKDTMTFHMGRQPQDRRERPALMIRDSVLIYNIAKIPFKKTFANAKELVMALPSVVSPDGNRLEVVGAKVTTLIVTGIIEAPNNTYNILESLPAEKVKRVIVKYTNGPTEEWPFAAGATLNVFLRRK